MVVTVQHPVRVSVESETISFCSFHLDFIVIYSFCWFFLDLLSIYQVQRQTQPHKFTPTCFILHTFLSTKSHKKPKHCAWQSLTFVFLKCFSLLHSPCLYYHLESIELQNNLFLCQHCKAQMCESESVKSSHPFYIEFEKYICKHAQPIMVYSWYNI